MTLPLHGFDRTDRIILGVIVIAGIVVDLACRLIPADLPYLAPFIFNIPFFAGPLVIGAWYGRGLVRTPVAERPALWRRVVFFGGLGLVYFVMQTRFEYAAQHMFFLNRIQQMSLGVFAPFLLAFAWPRETLARGMPAGVKGVFAAGWVRRPLAVLRFPLVAALILIAVTDVWVIPAVEFASMIDPMLYAVMNASMIGAGLLFWFVVLDPRPRPQAPYSYFARMTAGFLTMFPQILVASYIALSETSFYGFFDLCGRLFPTISPLHDQLLGGMIQWIPPGLCNTAVLFIMLHAIRRDEEKQTRETPIPPGVRVIEARWTGR